MTKTIAEMATIVMTLLMTASSTINHYKLKHKQTLETEVRFRFLRRHARRIA